MEFLDKKEEVIHFELTSYGRHLLSLGRLKPHYYAFYDDDIEYDVGWSKDASGNQIVENQGDAKIRILKETPYLKAQTNFFGLDQKLSSEETYVDITDIRYPSSDEKAHMLNYPLGSSDQLSENRAPSWEVTYLHGSPVEVTSSNVSKILSNTTNARLSASLPFKNIPQIDITLEHELSIRNIYSDSEEHELEVSPNLPLSEPTADGTYVSIKEEQILLHFLERHGFRHKDSYSVEVFLYDDSEVDNLIPLQFQNDQSRQKIQNNMLRDINNFDPRLTEGDRANANPALDEQQKIDEEDDPRFVEYFFSLRIDRDIPEEDICEGILKLKREDIYLDLDYDCLERDEALDVNIYNTGVNDADIEDCE